MTRLFWKIFLSFWISMIGIVGAFAWIQHSVNQFYGVSALPDHLQDMMRGSAERAADILRRRGRDGGSRPLTRWLNRGRTPRGTQIFVFDGKGREILDRDLPEPFAHLKDPGEPPNIQSSPRYYALTALDAQGRKFRVVSMSAVPPRFLRGFGSEGPGLRLLVAVLISALVCFVLARYLTRPVQRLSWAAREMAGGNLGVRVGQPGRYGSDELGQMAEEFDRMAGRLEESIGLQRQLLVDVSHELRSPLARLQIANELARQRAGDAAGPELDRIEREAEKLNELIGEILHLVRQANDERPMEREELDLNELVEAVVDDARLEAEAHDQTLSLEASPSPIHFQGHAILLSRAIENVVRNALRHSPENGEVMLSLSDSEGRIELRIADQGPGVDAGDLENIFRPFYRVGEARDRASGGYGLGLAIARSAIERHGGEIRANNRPEGGLEVVIDLPTS